MSGMRKRKWRGERRGRSGEKEIREEKRGKNKGKGDKEGQVYTLPVSE